MSEKRMINVKKLKEAIDKFFEDRPHRLGISIHETSELIDSLAQPVGSMYQTVGDPVKLSENHVAQQIEKSPVKTDAIEAVMELFDSRIWPTSKKIREARAELAEIRRNG